MLYIFKCINELFKKILLGQIIQKFTVFGQNGFIHIVFVIPSFFNRFNNARFHQYFDMVRNRGLGQVYHILDLGTLSAATLFGDMHKYLQAVIIAQSLRNLFNIFNSQCQKNVLINANISILAVIQNVFSESLSFLTFCVTKQKILFRQ